MSSAPSSSDLAASLLHGQGAASCAPDNRRDGFLVLLEVYDLHLAPLEQLGDAVRLQGNPAVAALKTQLEEPWLAELELSSAALVQEADPTDPEGVVSCLRAIAVEDRLPPAYRWLAGTADRDQLVRFLALEGGPDGGFDDLVAVCQLGLSGSAKLELGKNYWDEMGRGDPNRVHTEMHRRMVQALGLPRIEREELPVTALERIALGGLLATNRRLQPEMVGALGLTELQAGPRCRMVLQAFDRLGVPREAYPFYLEHAEVDPVHGRDWVDKAVVPLVRQWPDWGPRIVAGAHWRARTNLAFFREVHELLAGDREASAA